MKFNYKSVIPIFPRPVGAVWNRTGLEKEGSKIQTIQQFISN